MNLTLRILAATVIAFAFSFLADSSTNSWEAACLDALLQVREPTPVAREILLLEGETAVRADNPGEPSPAELIWTLAELRAEQVLLPPSWPAVDKAVAGASASAPKRAALLEQEFALIDENITALFEAIRIGSIDPKDADRFVEELRRIVADSKSRIQNGLVRGAGSSSASVETLIEAFGSDRLGRELSELGVSLPSYPSAEAIPIPPGGEDGDPEFRRLPHASISRYISLANRLALGLSAMEEAGYFDEIDPRNRPSIMRDHVRSLREELVEQPTEARAAAWREAAEDYFEAIAGLIDGETEARLMERFDAIEETGNLEAESAVHVREMKQELSTTLASLREEYAQVTALRNELAEAIGGSFVVLGGGATGADARVGDVTLPTQRRLTEGERRAVALNSALVGEHLYAPVGWNRALLLTAAGLIIGMILAPFPLAVVVALSPGALLLVTALFPGLFFATDLWVDPGSVVAVLIGAMSASILAAGLSQWSVERTLTGRRVDRLPSRLFRRTVFRGNLPKSATGRRRAVVVVVAPEAHSHDDKPSRKGPKAGETGSFHRAISRRIRQLGGAIVGEEGATVFAAFGATSTEDAGRGTSQQVANIRLAKSGCAAAGRLVSTTFPGGITVRCGVEIGELLFYVSPIGGYRATGRPLTYARRLCVLTRKHRHRILFGESVVSAGREEGDPGRFQEEGKLGVRGAGGGYAFYSLTDIDPPSL